MPDDKNSLKVKEEASGGHHSHEQAFGCQGASVPFPALRALPALCLCLCLCFICLSLSHLPLSFIYI